MATKKKVKLRKPTSDPTAYMPNAGREDDGVDRNQKVCDDDHEKGFKALTKEAKAKKKAMMQKEGYGKRTTKAGD